MNKQLQNGTSRAEIEQEHGSEPERLEWKLRFHRTFSRDRRGDLAD